MIDKAGIQIELGNPIGCERLEGVYGNMSQSHYHTFYELYFLGKGLRTHIMTNEIYQTEPGEFMIFAPYVMHHSFSDSDTPFRRIVLYFREDAINSPELVEMLKNSSGLYQPTPKVTNIVHSYLVKILEEQDHTDVLHEATMNSLLNSLLISIMKSVTVSEKPKTENRITKVIDYIEHNYTKDIRLQDITNHFFISEYYLCHEFKKYTNRTIVQYINNIRVIHAQRLIMETKLSLTDIASRTGFASSTHFYRIFRTIVGKSPSEFRKLNNNKKKNITSN